MGSGGLEFRRAACMKEAIADGEESYFEKKCKRTKRNGAERRKTFNPTLSKTVVLMEHPYTCIVHTGEAKAFAYFVHLEGEKEAVARYKTKKQEEADLAREMWFPVRILTE